MANAYSTHNHITTTAQGTQDSREGFVLDFSGFQQDANPDYIPYEDWKLHDPFLTHRIKAPLTQRRADIAQPKLVGAFHPEGPIDFQNRNGIIIKHEDETQIYVPHDYQFALPTINLAAHDLIKLYGHEGFAKAELALIIEKSSVQTGHAQRELFDDWHTHVDSNTRVADIIYGFFTTLGTQFKLRNQEKTAPDHAICRFGGEIEHRSQTNMDMPTTRLWGAVIACANPKKYTDRRNLGENTAYLPNGKNDPLYQKFQTAAEHTLAHYKNVRSHPPQNLFEPTTI